MGIGSNLGDREGFLRAAVAGLPDLVGVSPVYETEPVGGPEGQPAYLNAVVELSTDLSGRQLLEVAQALEDASGRVRAQRWGPRTLDVDVLWIEGEECDEADLVVTDPVQAGVMTVMLVARRPSCVLPSS